MKDMGMLIDSLRGVNYGFLVSLLGCSKQKPNICSQDFAKKKDRNKN